MRDFNMSCAGAFVEVSSPSGTDYEGFVTSKVNGTPAYHWMRIRGVDPHSGAPALARLEVSPSLEELLGGSGALGHVCSRLRSAPNVKHFLEDLQEVLERLAYGSDSGHGSGVGSTGGFSNSRSSSSSSSRVMQLLLQDLDKLGWGCLEEFDQNAARMTLLYMDDYGREHRLRLTLPYNYPAVPPTTATDLPAPFTFSWRTPPAVKNVLGGLLPGGSDPCQPPPERLPRWGGHCGTPSAYGGGGDGGGACSSIADVFSAFQQAVSSHQPLWLCLDSLDHRARVLDPPPSVSASRRHLGPPVRRLALPSLARGGGGGGRMAGSLQLRLDPSDPRGPPPPGGVAFLGPAECVGDLRESFFSRVHLWSRASDPVENLELLLGQPLPPPLSKEGPALDDEAEPLGPVHMAECPICMLHMLPLGDGEDKEEGGVGGGDGVGCGSNTGLVPDVVCPTPACGLVFHVPCLAEWLRSLPDTRLSFNRLFGRCPFCSNPITVRM